VAEKIGPHVVKRFSGRHNKVILFLAPNLPPTREQRRTKGEEKVMTVSGEPQPSEEVPGELGLQQVVEVAEIVAHEINNLLNNILLHVAVLDRKVPPAIRAELGVIRQAGTRAGSLLNRWQQLNPRRPAQLQGVDLARSMREAAAPWPDVVRCEPAGALPPVLADPADLRRLLHLLLLHATAVSEGRAVTVAAAPEDGGIGLRVEDAGPAVDPALLERVFEPFGTARPLPTSDPNPLLELALALCKKLTRRQQGSIRAENRPEGGLRVVVTFRKANP
jgi:signal transduction histidine kinase